MAVDLDVPAWVESYVRSWLERLHIEMWHIRLKLALVVKNDADVRASCAAQPEINTATITFRADIADTAAWRQTVIHELLHITHARVDHYITHALAPQVAEAAQPLAHVAYMEPMESFINYMADSLYWCTRYRDYPDEYPQDAPDG